MQEPTLSHQAVCPPGRALHTQPCPESQSHSSWGLSGQGWQSLHPLPCEVGPALARAPSSPVSLTRGRPSTNVAT